MDEREGDCGVAVEVEIIKTKNPDQSGFLVFIYSGTYSCPYTIA